MGDCGRAETRSALVNLPDPSFPTIRSISTPDRELVVLNELFHLALRQFSTQCFIVDVIRDVRPFNSILSVVLFEEGLEHVNGILVCQSQFQFIRRPMHVFHFPDQRHFVAPILGQDLVCSGFVFQNWS